MSTILLFMGNSGAGKSTLEKKLIEKYPKLFKKVISHTTREPRNNDKVQEKNGIDYHFVTLEKFKELENNNKFVQKTQIKDVYYASALEEYESNHKYIILTVVPKEAEKLQSKLKSLGINKFKSVLFDVSREKITENLLKDGFDLNIINERLDRINLLKEFNETKLKKDIVINDDLLDDNLDNWFLKKLGEA